MKLVVLCRQASSIVILCRQASSMTANMKKQLQVFYSFFNYQLKVCASLASYSMPNLHFFGANKVQI